MRATTCRRTSQRTSQICCVATSHVRARADLQLPADRHMSLVARWQIPRADGSENYAGDIVDLPRCKAQAAWRLVSLGSCCSRQHEAHLPKAAGRLEAEAPGPRWRPDMDF